MMQGKDWVMLVGAAIVASLGVFLGADVSLESWSDMNVPRLVLGSIVAFVASVVSFFAKSPRQ